jgi:hypothetical protein
MSDRILANNMKAVRGNTLCETQLTAGDLPASGSYIDVSGYEYVHVVVHLGTVHNSDSPTFELKVAEAANGTLDRIDSTAVITPAVSDDGEFLFWTVKVDTLPVDHHFVSVTVGGTLANGSFADVIYLLDGARHKPVTQTQFSTGNSWSWVS